MPLLGETWRVLTASGSLRSRMQQQKHTHLKLANKCPLRTGAGLAGCLPKLHAAAAGARCPLLPAAGCCQHQSLLVWCKGEGTAGHMVRNKHHVVKGQAEVC